MPSFFGTNAFKFGLFGANCAGGMTLSAAPERWRAEWDEIDALYRLADAAGIEFILPIAKWRGLGGQADMWGRSYETFTHGAAAAAITRRIGIFVTAHVPITSPAFAAKAIATIDHVSLGRAGLNIVCGWNRDEFDIHGAGVDPDTRYDQGLEWFKIFAKVCGGGPPFDWDGRFYKLRGVLTDPLPLQRPHPPVMSAGVSGPGREFAAQSADILFTSVGDPAQAPAIVQAVHAVAARHGRRIDVYTQTQVVCRATQREAEEFYHYFAEEHADLDALAYFRRQKRATLTEGKAGAVYERTNVNRFTRASGQGYAGTFPGVLPVVGSPDSVAAELALLSTAGLAGSALVFLNYLQELPYFVQEVLPRLQRIGLRRSVADDAEAHAVSA